MHPHASLARCMATSRKSCRATSRGIGKNVSSILFDTKSLPVAFGGESRNSVNSPRPLFTFDTPRLGLKEQIIRPFACEE